MANIKITSAIAATVISFSASVSSVTSTTTDENRISAVVTPQIQIGFSHILVPSRTLAPISVSIAEVINSKSITHPLTDTPSITESSTMSVTHPLTETPSVTDAPVFNMAQVLADTVTISATPTKVFHANFDFDLSDADIDPDPVSASDVDAKSITHPLTDTPSIADSSAMNITPAGKTESISAADALVFNASIVSTDSISAGDSGGLVINYVYTDVEDTTLGGHYFNQTPINPGGYE
tara:strand:- start:157 stop:870 length:714 start_codon:yes stop_codon:yes gene_type:complete